MTDPNEAAKDAWKAETSGAERVEQILETTREPAAVSEFADRALVSEPTARKYLEELVERGVAEAVQDGRTTTYARNEEELLERRIRELRETQSRDDLVEGIREMKRELAAYREKYGVESPEELARELDPDEDGWTDLNEWRTTRRNLAIAQAALSFDEAYRLVEA